ncbi:MAG: phosphopyruvate hydratase, partial [Candidatus Aenigmarchaeota archaeon]|nr:phosphopyruvate hydratase [Candidatus Aenigmarchaeota archaeon]
NLGANAILSVSLASARALANARQIPLWKLIKQAYQLDNSFKLPIPTLNVINGGRHADSGLDIQEFMIVPQGLKDFRSQFRAGVEIYHVLKKILLERGYTIGIGDEGGFAPHLAKNELAFEILVEAINQAGYQPGKEISLAIDAAASEFYQSGSYLFEKKQRTAQEMVDIYQSWLKKYPLISIEDGLSEDDWSNWSQMMVNFKKNYPSVISVGDDLFVTNQRRLQKGIDQQVANAILIKLNQIGSLSETIACIKLAQQNNYRFIISHRSGETNDDFITDLAVATGADFIKTGAPQRGERLAKYNRLLQIENEQNK